MTKALFLTAVCTLLPVAARADSSSDPALPSSGFSGDRYAALWTKSPFAIATPEATASADYELVGLAQFDGVSYASLVDKQTQEHFVLTSQRSVKNLTLLSVSHNAQGSSAILDRAGERLVLQEETAPASAAAPLPIPVAASNLSGNPSVGGLTRPIRPRARFHRPLIVVPPRPTSSD